MHNPLSTYACMYMYPEVCTCTLIILIIRIGLVENYSSAFLLYEVLMIWFKYESVRARKYSSLYACQY